MDLGDLKYLDAPAKVLKLSTAIRIGCLIRPIKAEGALFEKGGSCALGAAYEGATGKQGVLFRPIFDLWPELESAPGRGLFSKLGQRIVNMNDDGLRREDIATWLESQGL